MQCTSGSNHRSTAKLAAWRGSRCLAAAGVGAVLALAGCRSGEGEAMPSASAPLSTQRSITTTTSTAPPTTVPPTAPFVTSPNTAAGAAEQEIIESYIGYWDARYQAGREPVNPESPLLAEFATGRQLETVREETRYRQEHGQAFRYPEASLARRSVQVVSVAPERAEVIDCVIDDGVLYEIATGKVLNDELASQSLRAELWLVEGRWRVEAAFFIEQWAGVAGCALAGT